MAGQEQGITLQSLIITSVFLVIAVGVSTVLFAINSGSSEDLEAAGRSGPAADSCRPNEIFDLDWESKGLGGPQDKRGDKSSKIGCRPHCATWEFMTAGPNDDGEYELSKDWLLITQGNVGGPKGNEGVFSSRTGCFAPCYWHFDSKNVQKSAPEAGDVKSTLSQLRYAADNRSPGVDEVRLGVVQWRTTDDNPDPMLAFAETDVIRAGEPIFTSIIIQKAAIFRIGATTSPGKPLPQRLIELGIPTVIFPNWVSEHETDPGPGNRFGTAWEDEDWEVRADPENEVCEIVNTARDNELVCTSARENCAPA